ncbi:MAG: glycosyltransferase [Dehalococcoidales bacterium]|nr:glycosyltransferase [Dehalococcoidales bacterium]
MKAAHFSVVAPNRMGLYGTVRDLIKGERFHGIDAQIVDYGYDDKEESRIITDDWLSSASVESIMDADIVVRHSATPRSVTDKIPHLLALHGRPINTFLLTFQDRKNPLIETIYQIGEQKNFKGYLCFWERNTTVWRALLPDMPIYQVPSPCDLERFTPEGKTHKLKGEYDFRILIADMWREDSCPITGFIKALETAEKISTITGARIQVNALGTPKRARELIELIRVKSRNQYIGEIYPMVENPEVLFRAADAVITSHGLATRVVRESLACGTPVISLDPAPEYLAYTARGHEGELDLTGAIGRLMMKTREERQIESRRYAEATFDPARAGARMKEIFERVLK